MRHTAAGTIAFFALAAALLAPARSHAVTAFPWPVTVTQPDGTEVTLQRHGDEFFHWTTTSDGYDVVQGSGGYYYFSQMASDGRQTATKYVARNASGRDAAVKAYLATRTRNAVASQAGALAAAARLQARQLNPNALSDEYLRSRFRAGAQGLTRDAGPRPTKFLVILAQYSDIKFASPATAVSDFGSLLNQSGYSVNGAVGSVKDYFTDNSGGTFSPQFDVVGPYTLTQPRAYYGANTGADNHDTNPRQMITDACAAAQAAGVNFMQYVDSPGNIIASVFVVYAGGNEADYSGPAESVWPHQSYFATNTQFGGANMNAYACVSELANYGTKGYPLLKMTPIGTFCHEYGHTLGLPDFYDTDYEENGQSVGLGSFSIMSAGNYNGPTSASGTVPAAYTSVERDLLGWNVLSEFTAGSVTLQPVQNNRSYVAYTAYSPYEYFVFENRQQTYKWDGYIGASGLLVYHIDRSNRIVANGLSAASLWTMYYDALNAYANHPCAMLLATGTAGTYFNSQLYVFPSPGPNSVTALSNTTTPSLAAWDGGKIAWQLSNIRQMADGTVTFTASPSDGAPVQTSLPVSTINGSSTYKIKDNAVFSVTSPVNNVGIAWYVNGTLLNSTTITAAVSFSAVGEYQVKAVCTRTNGSTEVLVKYVTVTN